MISHRNIQDFGKPISNSKSIELNHILSIFSFNHRFKIGTPEIQLTCLKYFKSYALNQPDLLIDLEGLSRYCYFFVLTFLIRRHESIEFVNGHKYSFAVNNSNSYDNKLESN